MSSSPSWVLEAIKVGLTFPLILQSFLIFREISLSSEGISWSNLRLPHMSIFLIWEISLNLSLSDSYCARIKSKESTDSLINELYFK